MVTSVYALDLINRRENIDKMFEARAKCRGWACQEVYCMGAKEELRPVIGDIIEKFEEEHKVNQHKWKLSEYRTPSGKILYYCPRCKLLDPAPVKPKFEHRPCEPGLYDGSKPVMPAGKGDLGENRQGC